MAYRYVFNEDPVQYDNRGHVKVDDENVRIPKSISAMNKRFTSEKKNILKGHQGPLLNYLQKHRNTAAHGELAFPKDADVELVVGGTKELIEQVICHFCPEQTAEDLVARGKVRANFGKYTEAIEDFNKAIELDLALGEAYYNRGIANAALGNNEGAIEDFTKAIDAKWNLAVNYFNRAQAHENNGNLDKAREDFDAAIAKSGNKYPEAFYRRGLLTGDQNEAIVLYFDVAIELKEDYSEAYYGRAKVHYDRDDFNLALSDLDEAIRLNPEFTEAYRIRGLIKSKLELYQSAVVDFDVVLRKNQQDIRDSSATRIHAD